MKIGILTHHYVKNYGAFLQCYALQECLNKMFPKDEIYIIDYVNYKHLLINVAGWFRFNINKDSFKSYIQKIQIPFIFSKIENKYLNKTKKAKNYKDINKLKLDMIIIGSDEVWNYEDKKSFDLIKFGKNLKCKNIITYAPSTGKSNVDKCPNSVIQALKNIKSFSARDDNAEKLVNKYTDKKCTRVLDPTFLYDFPDYNSMLINKIKKENYILIYYCDGITDNMIFEIKKYAKKNNFKIYGAGEYKNWFDTLPVNVNPFEWVELFKNAEMVITGTFHGTVFSIKCKKNFYNYTTNESRIRKINSLLKQLSIKDRNLSICKIGENDIDYKRVYNIIEIEKNKSLDYIKSNRVTD